MKTFKLWLVGRTLLECNLYLRENAAEIPSLELSVKDLSSLTDDLLRRYEREGRIQGPYGGIRNPPKVFVNKIRHELTNYDKVRDAITRAGMEFCQEIDVRAGLVHRVKSYVDAVINSLKFPLKIPGNLVTKGDLLRANKDYVNREMDDLIRQKQARCD